MPLTSEQSQYISNAVGQKVTERCPLCGVKAWGWLPDLVVLQTHRYETAPPQGGLQSLFPPSPPLPPPLAPPVYTSESSGSPLERLADIMAARRTPPPPAYPMLLLMCNNCGNTMLLNVYTLGIADIWPAIAAGKLG